MARSSVGETTTPRILVWLSISAIFTATDAAKAGPFQDFFRTVRSAIAHPKETPRPHRSTHKRKKTPPSDASNSQTSRKANPCAAGPARRPVGEGRLDRGRRKSQPTVWNSGAGKTRLSYESVRAGCRLRPSHRFSAGNPGRRSLHRQNFPYAVRSAHIIPSHYPRCKNMTMAMTGPRLTIEGSLGSVLVKGTSPGLLATIALLTKPATANLQSARSHLSVWNILVI